MFSAAAKILTLLTAAAAYVRADPNPNSPGPGDVFIQGSPCFISWVADPTGVWKSMNIDLMTGNNFDMVFLSSVATGLDGTNPSENTFSYTCPQVTPHSAIYFYQFSSPSTTNKTWTSRFAITDTVSHIIAPSKSVQPDGAKISWGIGSLTNGSSSVVSAASGNTSTPTPSGPTMTAGSSLRHTHTLSLVRATSARATPTAISNKMNGTPATLRVANMVLWTAILLGLVASGFVMVL